MQQYYNAIVKLIDFIKQPLSEDGSNNNRMSQALMSQVQILNDVQ